MIDLRIPLVAVGLLAPPLSAQSVLLPNGEPDPAYPALWSWYDAAHGPNGSPTPLADGTSVTSWDDRSINARHLTRVSADPSRLPTVRDDADSCGVAMGFDGNDFIWAASTDIGRLAGDRTFVVVTRVQVADGGYVFDGSTNSGRSTLHAGETATPGKWHMFWGDNTATGATGASLVSADVDVERYQIHTVVVAAGLQEHYVNGQLVASSNDPNTFNLGGMVVGARVNTANGLNGYVKELLTYGEVLSAGNRAALEGYLVARHPFAYGERYGQGCAGTAGIVPALSVRGCPAPGQRIDLVVSDALPNSTAVVDFGLSRVSVNLGGCDILIGPVVAGIGGPTDAMGTLSFPLAVPMGIAVRLPTQAVILDPSGMLGFVTTNGLELAIF